MGTDPETDDYEEGVECPLCVDLLFGGVTPKYVEADITGIVKCPGTPIEPPNGTFLLTQTVLPCVWEYVDVPLVIRWRLLADRSIFDVRWFEAFWFFNRIDEICFDAFVNENVCDGVQIAGQDGYALIWWGPTIGP